MGAAAVSLFTTLSRYLHTHTHDPSGPACLSGQSGGSALTCPGWSWPRPHRCRTAAHPRYHGVPPAPPTGTFTNKQCAHRAHTCTQACVSVPSRRSDLKDDLDALVEEAVDQNDGAVERHDRQEESEEPGQADGGDDSQILHVSIQQREEGPGQVLKHALIHQSTYRTHPRQDPCKLAAPLAACLTPHPPSFC